MTAESKDPREELQKIAKLLVDDLLDTADSELLENATQDDSLLDLAARAKGSYQKALQKVGAKRLQTARSELEFENSHLSNIANIDAARARKIITKLTAANDPRLTLAARNLKNISDAEAIDWVKELIELGAIKKDDES